MRRRWVLAAILTLATFLRFYHLDRFPPGLYFDEAMDGNNAMEALESRQFDVFYPEDNGREGFYVNAAAISIAVFGNHAWSLRLPAAIFGVVTVLGLYLLVAEWIGPWEALLAAFLLATSFWHLIFSRVAFRAIAAPMFLVWAVWLLMVAARRGRVWWFVLAGSAYGLGFYTYPAYRVTVVLVAALLLAGYLAGRRQKATVRPTSILVFSVSAIVVAAPLAWYFIQNPDMFWGRASQVSVLDRPSPAFEVVRNVWRTGRMLFTRGDHNWRHNVGWRAELFWPVALCFILGLWPALRKYRMALLWLALAMLPAVFATEAPHALRAILMLPAVCAIAALGARLVWQWLARRIPARLLQAAAALAVLALAYEPYHTYFDVWVRDPHTAEAFGSKATELAERIAAEPRGRYVIVVDNAPEMMVYGLPVDLEPVMFLTGSYTPNQREERRIQYVAGQDCVVVRGQNPQATVFCADF